MRRVELSARALSNIRQLTISDLLAESIRRVSNEESISALFGDGVHDLERWDVRLRHGSVETAWFAFDPDLAPASDADASPLGEKCVLLALRRSGEPLRPLSRADDLVAGDHVFVALHRAELAAATEVLAARGLLPAPDLDTGEAGGERGAD